MAGTMGVCATRILAALAIQDQEIKGELSKGGWSKKFNKIGGGKRQEQALRGANLKIKGFFNVREVTSIY